MINCVQNLQKEGGKERAGKWVKGEGEKFYLLRIIPMNYMKFILFILIKIHSQKLRGTNPSKCIFKNHD